MKVSRIGMDIAKDVFQLHGVDAAERTVLTKKLKRAQVLGFFREIERCQIAMEACGGAHYWARELSALGHTVKLIAPQFVKPYVKSNKNDAADAEGICEAMGRPGMRFVPIKSVEQQDILAVHRIRSGLIKQRTATANQVRGLLAEYGVVIPRALDRLRAALAQLAEPEANAMQEPPAGGRGRVASSMAQSALKAPKSAILEAERAKLSARLRELLEEQRLELVSLDRRIGEIDSRIAQICRSNDAARRLMTIPGVGPISACALVATVGDASAFKNGRDMAAFLGLVPRQHSSGGREKLLGISKRGDSYLRTLLIHGARSAQRFASNKTDRQSRWLNALSARRHSNVAAVALANKNARIAWALLSKGDTYQAQQSANV